MLSCLVASLKKTCQTHIEHGMSYVHATLAKSVPRHVEWRVVCPSAQEIVTCLDHWYSRFWLYDVLSALNGFLLPEPGDFRTSNFNHGGQTVSQPQSVCTVRSRLLTPEISLQPIPYSPHEQFQSQRTDGIAAAHCCGPDDCSLTPEISLQPIPYSPHEQFQSQRTDGIAAAVSLHSAVTSHCCGPDDCSLTLEISLQPIPYSPHEQFQSQRTDGIAAESVCTVRSHDCSLTLEISFSPYHISHEQFQSADRRYRSRSQFAVRPYHTLRTSNFNHGGQTVSQPQSVCQCGHVVDVALLGPDDCSLTLEISLQPIPYSPHEQFQSRRTDGIAAAVSLHSAVTSVTCSTAVVQMTAV
ncbi:hypothetical protein J6590_024179 [Homalodisca vitripennis]|nr:hypothetical protein J6590_024179 [Homalodisca vitripennis]